MKKLGLVASAITLSIGLVACSNSDTTSEKKEEKAEKTVDVKKPMMKYYFSVSKTINVNDADLNAYEGAPDAKLQPAASASAAKVAEELKKLEIPAELKDQKADIEAAMKDLAGSYEAKAEELKKEKPSLDAANATFTSGDEKLGAVVKEVGFKESGSLAGQVN